MNTVYVNNNTNSIISSASIISNDDDGIIVNNSNCWQLIPDKDITKQVVYTKSYPDETLPVLRKQRKEKMADEHPAEEAYTETLIYDVGFKGFTVCTRTPAEVSGIISKPISTDNISYFTVSGDIFGNGSVEFSILDGSNEVPILPDKTNVVFEEKLFYNLETNDISTRFPIDMIHGIDPILYEDGITVSKDYQELTQEEFAKHRYCLTYTAAGNTQQYVPSSKEIRLKILIRQYDLEPVYVYDVMVHGYGGSVLWTSKVSD